MPGKKFFENIFVPGAANDCLSSFGRHAETHHTGLWERCNRGRPPPSVIRPFMLLPGTGPEIPFVPDFAIPFFHSMIPRGSTRKSLPSPAFHRLPPRLVVRTVRRPFSRTLFFLALTALASAAQIDLPDGKPTSSPKNFVDMLVLGDDASETGHGLKAAFPPPVEVKDSTTPAPSNPSATPPSEVVTGGLNQRTRVLLPRAPQADMYGGELTFTMKVDPVNQNYFTIKLWGSDPNGENALILYCENFEIGTRHGEAAADLFVNHGGVWLPNRFWYRTATLPLKLTRGKTSVSLTVRSAGRIYDYAGPHAPYIPNYQHLMQSPSWQIYRVYTHVGGYVDTTGEGQGPANNAPTRTTPGPEIMEEWKKIVSGKAVNLMKAKSMSLLDMEYLAQCYEVSWTPAFRKKEAADALIRAADETVKAYAQDNNDPANQNKYHNDAWGGSYGPMGIAVSMLYPDLKARMEEKVDFGGSVGAVTRKEGWSKALRASVDFGRFNRRGLSNQELDCAMQIYLANRGLLAIDPANALQEKEALRYMYEASGLLPFLGNDQPGGGAAPVRGIDSKENRLWYGANWFDITTKGLSKEPGLVASDYGELGGTVYNIGHLANDRKLMERGIQMMQARMHFRFPGIDGNGFGVMMAAAPIGHRNNYLPAHYAYVSRGVEAGMLARENVPDLQACFQQQIADGQLYAMIAGSGEITTPEGRRSLSRQAGSVGAPYLPDDLATALAKPKSNLRMPTAIGAPDFAWGDEEDMVVAAKHGEECFFANLFWRGPSHINKAANVFLVTPTAAARAEVQLDDIRYVPTGRYETGTGSVDKFGNRNPPDNKQHPNAESGNRYPIAVRPDLKDHAPERNQDGGRGTGYTLAYGHWLVGMNGNYTTGTYTMKLPPGFAGGVDLISGKTLKAPVIIPRGTTVVFYLPQPAAIPKSPDSTLDPEEKP